MDWTGVHFWISAFDSRHQKMVVAAGAKDKKEENLEKKSPKSPVDKVKKSVGELKIFKTRKEVKSPTVEKEPIKSPAPKESDGKEDRHRSRHKSPTKLLKRLLSPQRNEPKAQVKKVTTPNTPKALSPKPKKTKSPNPREKSPKLNGKRDVHPPPSIELDPDEGKLKISNANNSAQKTSQTVVMHRKISHETCQVHVVPRRNQTSVDNLNGSGQKLRNEFFYPQRSSICATFTLDRPKKLADIVGPKSPGLVSQHQNSAFTSSTSINSSINNPLNSRSMSSHQLLNQLNQQQQNQGALSNSASSTTIHSSCLNPDQIEVLTSTDSTPTQSNSPHTNTLPKFPANQQELSPKKVEKPILEEEEEEGVKDAQEEMIESVSAKTATLADKLSRSFFDLTQGSQDRLAKWKSKLQHYGQQQRQRSTERETNSSRRMASLDGSVPVNDVVIDWRTEPTAKPRRNPPQPPPRPLHSSRSATNALSHGLSLESSLPMSRHQHIGTSTATLPHTLHKSASVREADTLVNEHRLASHRSNSPQTVSTMEHRTLKQRENLITGRRSPTTDTTRAQHMRSLHELVQSIEGFQQNASSNDKPRNINLHNSRSVLSQDCGNNLDSVELPPPAKIMPYSGIKPQDNGIIRPIAFRPLANSAGLKHASNRHSNSPDAMPSFYNRSNLTSIEQHKQALKDHSRSIGNLNNLSTPRSRNPLQQPSTSQLFGGKSIGSLPTADENAYDVVPEYLNEPTNNEGNYSSIYPFHSQQHHQHRNHSQNAPKRQPNSNFFSATHSNGTNSSQFTNSSNSSATSTTSPPHNGLKKSVSGSQQNVQGHAGAHITPSPSDSGIILDYESLIREKETELSSVRQAMEQNEEVLIRVYQEKERQYKQQVDDLKQKLHSVQQGEASLRKQFRQSDDIRQQLQKSVQNLNDEKVEMQRKYAQIERELSQLRSRLDEQRPCDSCRRGGNQTQSIYENNGGNKPVPAPRLMNKDGDLRTEVDDLKSEVSMLREQLNRQVEFFEDERKRWQQNHHLSPDNTHPNNNNLPNKPTHFSAFQQRSLSEKRPLLSSNTDRLI